MPNYDQVRKKTLGDAISRISSNATKSMYTMLPGVIKEYDSTNGLATVQPLTMQWFYDSTVQGGGYAENMPEIREVPVCFDRSGNLVITKNVTVGDECLLYFAHKSSFGAYQTGEISLPYHLNNGDIEDAVALIKEFSIPKHNDIVSPSEDSLDIRTVDNNTVISIKNDGSSISLKVGGSTLTLEDGKLTIGVSEVEVNASDIKLNGDVTANTLTATTITADTVKTTAGIDLDLHKHGGVTTGAGVSGVSVP